MKLLTITIRIHQWYKHFDKIIGTLISFCRVLNHTIKLVSSVLTEDKSQVSLLPFTIKLLQLKSYNSWRNSDKTTAVRLKLLKFSNFHHSVKEATPKSWLISYDELSPLLSFVVSLNLQSMAFINKYTFCFSSF
jgi:hypothetical protein